MPGKRRIKDWEELPFDWSSEGMLEIFGESLYRSPTAFVRELLQNAQDACWEREYLEGGGVFSAASVGEVNVEYRDRTLIITDNGAGLSKDEAKKRLSKIGHKAKRSLASQMSIDLQSRVIGLYGVGLLSAIARSTSIMIESKRYDGSESIVWVKEDGKSGKKHPRLVSGDRKQVGTKVTMVIAPDEEEILERFETGALRNILSEFAKILPIKVFYEGSPVLQHSDIWDARKWEDFALLQSVQAGKRKKRKAGEQLLMCVPLKSDDLRLLEGALYVPRRTSIRGDGFVDVYINRMFISRDKDQLLPEWAPFIRGFVNSSKLPRVVSGDAIADSPLLEEAKEVIQATAIQLVVQMYRFLASKGKKTVLGYDDQIKAAIADEPGFDLLDALWKHLLFTVHVMSPAGRPATRHMTLPEYCRLATKAGASDRTIHAYEDYGDTALCSLLLKITGVPIVKAINTADALTLSYIHDRDVIDIKVLPAKAAMAHHFRLYEGDDVESLLEIAEDLLPCRCVASSFEPSSIPALYLSTSQKNEYSLFEEPDEGQPMLILNAGNGVIRKLASMNPCDPLVPEVFMSIHNDAVMFTIREFAGDELEKAHETHNRALEILLTRAYSAPLEPVPIDAAILVLDITGSTYRLACLSFEERGEVFHNFVEAVREVVDRNRGFFDKFTGDGLIAIFSRYFTGDDENPARSARFCAAELRLTTQRFFEEDHVLDMLRREGQDSPGVRVGLAYGRVAYGRFGGRGTIVGKAMVEASRLCESKELHDQFPGCPIATMHFAQQAGLVPDKQYTIIGERDMRGLGPRTVVAVIG